MHTHSLGEYLINMGIHSYSLEVCAGFESSPVAERLECIVDELNRVACLAGAIRVSVEPDKRRRDMYIGMLESPYVPIGIVPILRYSIENGRAIISGRPGIKLWVTPCSPARGKLTHSGVR